MLDVITVGSAAIDVMVNTGSRLFHRRKGNIVEVPFGSKILVEGLHILTGGGGTNTAVCLSRLGLKTSYLGAIGDDNHGQRILKELKKEKVRTNLVAIKNGKTGYSVILDAKGRDRTILVYKGVANDLTGKDVRLKKVKAKWLYVSSMLGKSLKTTQVLIKHQHSAGGRVMLNPSQYLIKREKKMLKQLLQETTILVLNRVEGGQLVGKGTPEQMLKKLAKKGPKIVLLTEGSKGAWAYDNNNIYQLIPRKVKVVETTGAGDAFGSSFLAAYHKTGSIEKALQIAQTNAESVITHFGAKEKLLSWKEAVKKSYRVLVK